MICALGRFDIGTAITATILQKTKSSLFADMMVIPLKKDLIQENSKEARTFKLRSDPKMRRALHTVYLLLPSTMEAQNNGLPSLRH